MKRKTISGILLLLVIIICGFGFLSFSKQGLSQSDLAGRLSGFGWSTNIGHVSYSSTDCDIDDDGLFEPGDGPAGCPTSGTAYKYKVNVSSTGNLSGYGWSEHIGWISFNETGCPTAPCQPSFDGTRLSGWAKAIQADGNGWDGWISLRKQSSEASGIFDYGPRILSGSLFSNYAWGEEVIGFLTFNKYEAITPPPSTPSGFTAQTGSSCGGRIDLSWNVTPGAVSYQVYRNGGGTPVYNGSSNLFTDTGLSFGSSYSYTVRATNSGGSSALTSSISATASAACAVSAVNCNLAISNIVKTKVIVNLPSQSCGPMTWDVVGVGGAPLDVTCPITSCTLDGNAVSKSGNSYSAPSISIGTHTIICTNASSTVSMTPRPQCRLNPSYGEF